MLLMHSQGEVKTRPTQLMSNTEQGQQFEVLVEQHKGILYKVAKTYCQDESDRQDLIQEIMIQLWQAFPRYNPQYKTSTWVYRIAINVAISFYRKYQRRKTKNVDLNDPTMYIAELENTEKEAQLQLLEQFIHELRDIDKALMLLYLEDRSQSEIAEIMGLSLSNVSTKVGRIKEQLKKKFTNSNKI
jgi:RNA polymerase sigma factor (sigma-70 family)